MCRLLVAKFNCGDPLLLVELPNTCNPMWGTWPFGKNLKKCKEYKVEVIQWLLGDCPGNGMVLDSMTKWDFQAVNDNNVLLCLEGKIGLQGRYIRDAPNEAERALEQFQLEILQPLVTQYIIDMEKTAISYNRRKLEEWCVAVGKEKNEGYRLLKEDKSAVLHIQAYLHYGLKDNEVPNLGPVRKWANWRFNINIATDASTEPRFDFPWIYHGASETRFEWEVTNLGYNGQLYPRGNPDFEPRGGYSLG